MTKKEMAAVVAEKAGIGRKQAEAAVEAAFGEVAKEIAGKGRCQVPGFGTFEKRERAARSGRNPRTGEPMEIAASATVGFKAAKALKDSL